jgi:hypothetical protein
MNTYGYGRERVIDMDNKAIAKLALLAGGLVLLALLLFASIAYVPTGHVGVLTLFGKVTGESLPEGVHLVNPLKVNNKMSIRTQELKEAASVPSSEGLIITLDTSLLFHLNPEKAPEVFQRIGPNYINVVVEPNLRSAIREAARRAGIAGHGLPPGPRAPGGRPQAHRGGGHPRLPAHRLPGHQRAVADLEGH